MDSTLNDISNSTKNTQIEVRMTKLQSYKVGAKTEDCRQSIPTSRRCCKMSRRLGSVLGGILAHFEPIMEGFKALTGGIEKGGGFVIDLGAF